VAPISPTPLPPLPPGATYEQRLQAATVFVTTASNLRQYNINGFLPTNQIVGVNNIGEITFEWPAGNAIKVNHRVRCYDPRFSTVNTIFVDCLVSLDPDDPQFQVQIPPPVVPTP
jgi:hypothetical protein